MVQLLDLDIEAHRTVRVIALFDESKLAEPSWAWELTQLLLLHRYSNSYPCNTCRH